MSEEPVYRGQAITSMSQTVDALEHQVARSRGYLKRARTSGEQ